MIPKHRAARDSKETIPKRRAARDSKETIPPRRADRTSEMWSRPSRPGDDPRLRQYLAVLSGRERAPAPRRSPVRRRAGTGRVRARSLVRRSAGARGVRNAPLAGVGAGASATPRPPGDADVDESTYEKLADGWETTFGGAPRRRRAGPRARARAPAGVKMKSYCCTNPNDYNYVTDEPCNGASRPRRVLAALAALAGPWLLLA